MNRPYSVASSLENREAADVGEQTAYSAGLSYFPDYMTAFEPMGDAVANVAGLLGTGLGGPAGGVTVGATVSAIEHFLGGGGVDAERAARVQYFLNLASQGNVAAAQLIIAAPSNVAGNERTMWTAAATALQSSATGSATLAQARAAGPVWFVNSGDTATNYPTMKNFTSQWGMSNQPVTTAVQGVYNAVTGLSGARPIALNSNMTPVLLLGVGGIAAYFAFGRKRRRRR
jgi:hypothetical protein